MFPPMQAPCMQTIHKHRHYAYSCAYSMRKCWPVDSSCVATALHFPVSLSFQIVDFSRTQPIGCTSCPTYICKMQCSCNARSSFAILTMAQYTATMLEHCDCDWKLQAQSSFKYPTYAVKATRIERSGTLLIQAVRLPSRLR